MANVGRNDPCPCGSGKKYKKCCEDKVKHKKFSAQVLTPQPSDSSTQGTAKLSSLFFKRDPLPPPPEEPKNPDL